MKIESAAISWAEISGEVVHRIGKYSFHNLKLICMQLQHVEPISSEVSCHSYG